MGFGAAQAAMRVRPQQSGCFASGRASFLKWTILFGNVAAGIGLGFLALVISYLPVVYQAFSRREVRISLLDAWAGSPPAAVEILRRLTVNDPSSCAPCLPPGVGSVGGSDP